jgi:predicted lipoprotein with Yx(FWY)xxD motif
MNTRATPARTGYRVAFFGMIVLALALAGCSASLTPAPATQAPAAPAAALTPDQMPPPPDVPATAAPGQATAAPAAGATLPATVTLTKNDQFGSFLADGKGMTLYLFTNDQPDTSNCTGACLQAWPPLLTKGEPLPGPGVDASLLGSMSRSDGSTQVTYNGWPLYYFAKDQKPGDVNGENVLGKWFVVSATGDMIQPAATAAPAATATSAPAASASSGAAGPATVTLTSNAQLGSFLADDRGMTLYLFTKDTPNTSNCYNSCAQLWPPLLTNGAPVAGSGVDASLLGTTTRTDGSTQVTYNGWPLYYYAPDTKPGDVTGQNFGGVWFVVSAKGDMIQAAPAAAPTATATSAPAASTSSGAAGPATVTLTGNAQLGSFLTDDKGMSLYLYTKDTPNTSNCYDKCAAAWPPLFTNGAPAAVSGADASLLGTTTRTDGSIQVTYNGWPLYYFAKDQKPGDVTGQNVGGVWFVVSAKGDMIK